jgi:hypothetical protein
MRLNGSDLDIPTRKSKRKTLSPDPVNSWPWVITSDIIDPTPQPLGCQEPCAFWYETPEQRAFRRFPIAAHKPGP